MTLFVVPLFMSPVIVGTFFSLILTQPYGPTNYLLGELLENPVTIDFTNDSPWVYFRSFWRMPGSGRLSCLSFSSLA